MIIIGAMLAIVGLLDLAFGWSGPAGWPRWLAIGLLSAGIALLIVAATVRRRGRPAGRRGLNVRSEATRPSAGGIVSRIRAVPAMIVDSWRGRCLLPRHHTLLWLVAVVYLVSPLDMGMDTLLPILGIPSDVGLGVWLVTSMYSAAGSYLAEQRTQISHETKAG